MRHTAECFSVSSKVADHHIPTMFGAHGPLLQMCYVQGLRTDWFGIVSRLAVIKFVLNPQLAWRLIMPRYSSCCFTGKGSRHFLGAALWSGHDRAVRDFNACLHRV